MNQAKALEIIQDKIKEAIEEKRFDNEEVNDFLKDISNDLEFFFQEGIDYKTVVDNLDDSLFITDGEGRVMYVNPSYEKNTGVMYEEVKGRLVKDIVDEGKLFTGGATLDVLKKKKRVFRLATIHKSNPPQVGYAVGVPVFHKKNPDKIRQVVVSSRPIFTLKELKDDYQRFLDEVNAIKDDKSNVQFHDSAEDYEISKNLIGKSPSLMNVWSLIKKIAPTDASVLITGESGVGKEIVADEIYKLSPRNGKQFVKVNCASIPANILESELFGYEKGAFSGASSSGKQGLFEVANNGTLLLDEIGDMPLDLQVKLLRAIQNKEITRVGGTKAIPLNIRIIASTNSDLKKKIAEGTFRQDLYYRLSVIPIQIPPLRERPEDIEELVRHFINLYGEHHNRHIDITDKEIKMLKRYDWPGNIRELENVIEYLTICSSGTGNIDMEMLTSLLNISEDSKVDYIDSNPEDDGTLADSLEHHEIARIKAALAKSKNLREAGAILGVNASTVSRKIKQYGIEYKTTRHD